MSSTLDDGERGEIRARFVIARRRTALGDRQAARTRADAALAAAAGARDALLATSRDVGEHGEMHVERDGYVGIADVGNGLTTVALVVPASRVARDRGRSRARFSHRWLAARAHLAPRFADAERATPVDRDRAVRVARAARVGAGRGARRRRRGLLRSIHRRRDLRGAARRRDARRRRRSAALARARRRATPTRVRRLRRARGARSSAASGSSSASIGAVVGAAPLINRAARASLGAEGSRGSAHRRDGEFRAGDARSSRCRISLEVSSALASIHDVSRSVA